MSARVTWFWFWVAVALAAAIIVDHRFIRRPPPGPARVLPRLDPATVTSVYVRPAGQLEIHATRTNHAWDLVEPITYPAQGASVDNLLAALERFTAPPATFISAAEIRSHPKADEDFGFATPQAYIILQQGDYRAQLQVGRKTAPGDQVFLQVVGAEGAYAVDTEFLKYIPRSVSDWRDTSLLDLRQIEFDRVIVTNNARSLEFEREAANQPWRLTKPIHARADQAKIAELFRNLQALSVQRFVTDDPRTDLDAFGLQPADLEIHLAQRSNAVAAVYFGKNPTNDPRQVFARLGGRDSVMTVLKDPLAPWRSTINEFRDPHLLDLTAPVASVEARGEDKFTVQNLTNGTWRVLPAGFPADAELVKEWLNILSAIPISEFVKDVVAPPDLPDYGLAKPARSVVLRTAATNAVPGTNTVLAEIYFGSSTNQADKDKVFARRADESAVYAIKLSDFQRLPVAGWQLRDRKLWTGAIDDVARLTIKQQGRTRQILRHAAHQWSLAPGSRGVINDLAVEETVRGLLQASAVVWVGRGDACRARCGFTDQSHRLILEFRNGDKTEIEFGGEAPSSLPYAAVTFDGEAWVCEFPWLLYRDIAQYLAAP